ncbi:hypothetical protein H632_c2772p0, partial [Helicosporidium sp. ATCC 50920]
MTRSRSTARPVSQLSPLAKPGAPEAFSRLADSWRLAPGFWAEEISRVLFFPTPSWSLLQGFEAWRWRSHPGGLSRPRSSALALSGAKPFGPESQTTPHGRYGNAQARILSPSEALESALKSESRPNKAPVAFFGDSAVAWVPEDRIMAWPAGLSLQTTRRKYALLWKAILEAAEWIRSRPLESPSPSPQKRAKKAKLVAPVPEIPVANPPPPPPREDFPDIVIQVVNGRLKAPAKAVLALLATRPPRDAYPSYVHLRQNLWLDARLRPRR